MKSIIKRSLFFLVCALVLAGIWVGISIKNVLDTLPDAYGIWGTGELIIAYIEENNKMPDSWEDLRPLWESGFGAHARSGQIETLDELMSVVKVEFDRLPELRLTAEKGIKTSPVITARSGASIRWENANADDMIIHYFRKRKD